MAPKSEPPRPDVVWQLIGDGMQPAAAPWGFVLRNPVSRALPPGQKMQLKLGVAASVPMIAWARAGADYVSVPQFIPPGQEVVVTVENRSAHASLVLEDAEALVNIHPLIFKGLAGVG